jgi:hypothetical protein
MRSREDLHLDPPPSHGGMHGSYTSGANWWLNSELRRTLLGFSEALIFLSYSAVGNWSLHRVTLPGLSVIGRLLYF